MITDENGVKHPETVIEEVELSREEEREEERTDQRERFWNRKAKREGWERPEHNQGRKPENNTESGKSSTDRYFERKRKREGW